MAVKWGLRGAGSGKVTFETAGRRSSGRQPLAEPDRNLAQMALAFEVTQRIRRVGVVDSSTRIGSEYRTLFRK
ncbi:hypothetical protein P3T23_003169 [Paraburkholderia sp. GAS448]